MAGFEALEKDGYRVGSKSQKILWALRTRGADRDWIRGSALRSAAGLSQNRRVFYRIERYLEPAGLVEEKERRREDGSRVFRLTDEGQRWVAAHEETLAATVGGRAAQQLAREAMDEAAAVKEAVQEYRKKLHSVKIDVDGLKEQSQAHADRLEELKSATDKIAVNASRIDKVEENKTDEQESRERLREVKQERARPIQCHTAPDSTWTSRQRPTADGSPGGTPSGGSNDCPRAHSRAVRRG